MGEQGFLAELRRRNVIRVAIAYLLLGWAVLQGADFLLDLAEAPGWVIKVFAIAGLVGFPFALAAAGAQDVALGVLRQSLARQMDFHPVALLRTSTLTGDFSCRPDVRAVYAELGLPPLPNPPDSDC